ncbi:MAG: hypothetical protein DMF50_08675, partial [Acidobacteria bacterium]
MSFQVRTSGSLLRFAFVLVLAVASTMTPAPAGDQAPGGFVEADNSTQVRARLTAAQIQAFLPARGAFVFPAPYSTQGIRLTNASDCGGADCVNYVGYSYYHNINNHVGSDTMYVFIGLNQSRGGAGPTLFSYNKVTDEVRNLGPLFASTSAYSWNSGEGWYFSATRPTTIYMNDGPRMLRYDVLSKQYETVFDATAQFGSNRYIWQMHSSDDDRVHSATLRDLSTYEMLGCMVYREDTKKFLYYPKTGDFDECAIDKSGRWLMSLENVDGLYDDEMRVFDIETGAATLIWDQDGAPGHADMGYGYIVGADNWNPMPNATLLWKLGSPVVKGPVVHYNKNWNIVASNHVAHGNAKPNTPPEQQYACGSNASRYTGAANEIVCYRLDASLNNLIVAPVMADLDAPGGGDDYSKMPKGNIDVTGQYFIWTSNVGSSRLDAFIVKVPAQLLTGSSDTTAPATAITAPAGGSSLAGITAIAATATDNVGVAGVQFRLDGANLGSEVPSAPYTFPWNTLAYANGSHTLTAVARDAAGNSTTSAPVSVTVSNDLTPPVLSAVGVTSVTAIGAVVVWTTDEPGDSQVECGTTTAYGVTTPLAAALVTAHAQTLTGLAAGNRYHYRVRSKDAAGNLAVSADATFNTLPAPAPMPDPTPTPTPTPIPGGGPLGYWKLDEGSGTTALDASGNGLNGTLLNGTAWTAGVVSQALSFDGLDDYVAVPHTAVLDAYPLTLAVWVKSGATGLRGIVNKYLPASMNGYQIFTNGGNLCAWYFKDASDYVWDGTGCTLMTGGYNDSQWHQV